ncbi:hypothetical protein Mal64_25290 [Pseudobythopirellula maris]|uniref:Uncharacterized protein n=1 Tax=Pseudobythopirellula maris TaxID=2527991 RepID=A0A5C5ZPG9_9BACT|nr:hypothetical protein [Pseudobythopirellula maris]TWT89038.1 hypothetical protein Mal64_25290 [Pseudobythopirellula maris]
MRFSKKPFLGNLNGEPDSMDALAETLRTERGWDVRCPELGERCELE